MHWNRAAALGALLVLCSAHAWAEESPALPLATLPDVNDLSAVTTHMQRLLDQGLDDPEWPANMRPQDIVVYDLTLMYAYSLEGGLKRLTTQPNVSPERDKPDGADANPVGTLANPSGGNEEPALLTTTETTYGPFRRIKSLDNGYTKVYAYITLPGSSDLYGLDGVDAYGVQCNEGAFNYFGLTNGSWDMECGVCTQHHMIDPEPEYRYNDAGRWYVYRSHPSGLPRAWLSLHDRPPGGLAPGSRVFMKMWVPADNEVKVYYACTGYDNLGEIYYDWMTGPKADGSGNRFRRVTSMVVGGIARSLNNSWDDISIYNSSAGDHLWESRDTAEVINGDSKGRGAASWITPVDQTVRYDETVNIKSPKIRARGQRGRK